MSEVIDEYSIFMRGEKKMKSSRPKIELKEQIWNPKRVLCIKRYILNNRKIGSSNYRFVCIHVDELTLYQKILCLVK